MGGNLVTYPLKLHILTPYVEIRNCVKAFSKTTKMHQHLHSLLLLRAMENGVYTDLETGLPDPMALAWAGRIEDVRTMVLWLEEAINDKIPNYDDRKIPSVLYKCTTMNMLFLKVLNGEEPAYNDIDGDEFFLEAKNYILDNAPRPFGIDVISPGMPGWFRTGIPFQKVVYGNDYWSWGTPSASVYSTSSTSSATASKSNVWNFSSDPVYKYEPYPTYWASEYPKPEKINIKVEYNDEAMAEIFKAFIKKKEEEEETK